MSWWGTLKKKAGLQIRKFSQSVSRATAAVQRTVSRGVTAIKKTASKTGTAIKRTVSKLTTTIKQNGVKVQKFITSAVKATKMAIKKGIKVAKTAVKKIVKAGKKIGKAAKAFAKKAVLQTQKFLNSMARATKAFTKKTKGTLEAAKQKATAFVKREGGKVVTQARKIKNNLSQNERVKRLKNDMRKALVLSKSFGKGVWDGGKEAFTDTVELAKQLWYNPEQTVQNIGQSLRGEYSKAKKFAGQMVSDPFGTTNKVILGIEKEYDEFQKLSPEQRAYVIGKFGGNKVVNLVGDKGLSVVTKQMAKAAMRLPPHVINVINNERGSISIGGSNRNKTTQGTGNVPRLIPGKTGVVTGGDSTKLGKNMMESMGLSRSTKWKGYQAQHIIPSQMKNHPVIKKIGMDFDDASNGIFLRVPANDVSAMSRHKGFHSVYNKAVERALDKIDVKQSPEALQKQVFELQQKLKRLQEKGLPLYPKQGATVELWERWLSK
ncbi:AHH domain-containing protein [Aneurinibacillus thermoaerophilus]|uniref:AHH domain-containing protein n=1 Tax=Aneurinibacillus thermoaerophilus TaxID=143495 RepID=UPI002E24F2AE|nr:AHH domain-containing protein [Aneurinibacillus thermoaerophilus]MED0762263.1 AHH domain-containing protein [Aneurinibacillus thermoaerophilus]